MNYGTIYSTKSTVNQNLSAHSDEVSKRSYSGSQFQQVLHRGRISDEDIEKFYSGILIAHKKKNYKVLAIAAILFLFLGFLFYFLVV
ncbi:hypothetical protein [Gramella sp. MAR_2010_147]|uniref:hypothetical protein n=1 Tax=Gramella sp. MAR_2010_147 TaxID=1250205 RepID=UPI00156118A2|nr:hypothetical protein [Gramella sp. MAR_2010_147]